ncbi:complex I NDUFA9 subunit family protein [Mesorhizobium sp. dw_380]|uniref:complex I NDUFA9 subunit family protein n=1 Tax=Mesorhizobium sp. dw_380 TaxID=2812001 RepID=UPI001BDDF981|nr:complex I NDUFA9 subunit family protein [Mesorhizobium sp. dw_380]
MATGSSGDGRGAGRIVTIFGGTGFLGRRIVKRLAEQGFTVRAVSRHPGRVRDAVSSRAGVEPIKADVLDPRQVAAVVSGCHAVVNAVSLYAEHGERTFERTHVKAAGDLAAASRDAGVEQFVLISGVGSDAGSGSKYIRARGRGEDAVESAFAGALIVRPCVMAGPDDAFLTTIVKLIRLLPVYPLFGQGGTRLQPVYVEDVAEGVSRLIADGGHNGSRIFEFGGPRVYSYRELLQEIAFQLQVRVTLAPMPFAMWDILAAVAEFLPAAPFNRSQIDLMRQDNVTAIGVPGLETLGIAPRNIDEIVWMIARSR